MFSPRADLVSSKVSTPEKPKAVPTPLSSAITPSSKSAPKPAANAVAPQAKANAFEPYIVRVKDGVAQIVGKAGETLLYVEVKLSELGESAKVWVLGMAETARQRTEPYAKAVLAKVKSMYKDASDRAISTVQPIYAKVVDGVVYLQGRVDLYVIAIKARVSDKWTMAVTKLSESYAHHVEPIYLVVKRNITDTVAWSKTKCSAASDKLMAVAEPYYMKAKDGSQYLRLQVGNTIVYVRTQMVAAGSRVSEMTMVAYNKAYKTLDYYTAPIIEKAVQMYQKLSAKLATALEPLTARVRRGAIDVKMAFNDVVTRVRVKAATVMDKTAKFKTECYLKLKNGYLYIQGKIGEIQLSIKVKVADITAAVNSKLQKMKSVAEKQFLEVSKIVKAKSAALKKELSDTQLQVTAASAVGGSVALGASGAATGLVTGAGIGAACGVVPAIFTFGLSIPVGAFLGGATGLCVGTVAGGTVGAVGGGAAGRSTYKHKDEIKLSYNKAVDKATEYKKLAADKAGDYKDKVVEKTSNVKARFVGGTGGTA